MKRWLLLACLLLCGPLRASPSDQEGAPDPGSSFALGVEAYRAGDLQAARSLWLAALQDPHPNLRAEALYNLGNVSWRERKPLEAVAWYSACIRIAPRHDDAWANLEFARAAAGLEPADRGDLAATAQRLLHLFTLEESEWIVLAAGCLFLAALAAQAWMGGAWLRRTVLAAGALALCSLLPWIANLRREARDELFLLAPEGAQVLSEPRPDATVLGKLSPGLRVQRRDELPGWVRVEGRDGSRKLDGWLRADAVFDLER